MIPGTVPGALGVLMTLGIVLGVLGGLMTPGTVPGDLGLLLIIPEDGGLAAFTLPGQT